MHHNFSLKKLLKIRVSYKSEIRETKIGSVFSFHEIDDTGEISFTSFGKNSTIHKDYVQVTFSIIEPLFLNSITLNPSDQPYLHDSKSCCLQ